jgi:hypothetical protein
MELYQKRSGKFARLTYLITLPLCVGMLFASTIAFSKDYGLLKLHLGRPSRSAMVSTPPTDDKQPGKKQRLKITSGSMTSITDKLEIRGNNGKPLIFTADNLTAENKKMLANWGMIVETTNAQATTYTLVLPPPPPRVPGTRANKLKQKTPHPLLPPPPPLPTSQQQSAKLKIIEIPLESQPDTVDKSQFSEMFKQVGRTTRFPQYRERKARAAW